jgi:uncharacterized low-complexity protein
MTKTLTRAALAIVLTAASITSASAWSRSASYSGPHGASRQASASCSGGSCSWSRGGTNRYGDSWSRSGSASCGGGSCTVTRGGMGIYGNSWSRTGTVTRN